MQRIPSEDSEEETAQDTGFCGQYETWVIENIFDYEEELEEELEQELLDVEEVDLEDLLGVSLDKVEEEQISIGTETNRIFVVARTLMLIAGLCLCILPGRESLKYWEMKEQMQSHHTKVVQSLVPQLKKSDVAQLGSILGVQCQYKMQAMQLATVAFVVILCSLFIPSHILLYHPSKVVSQFARKGTLQCVNEDVVTTRGRIFGVALFTAATLLIMSHYPLYIYRSWVPLHSESDNPLRLVMFQPRIERWIRVVWCFVPSLALIFAATIPNKSTQPAWVWVNRICMRVGEFGMLAGETLQLVYGELAFAYFFSPEPVPFYGPLTVCQRLRCVVLVFALSAAAFHLTFQLYLKLDWCGRVPKASWRIASHSFLAEAMMLSFIMALPCLAGLDVTIEADLTPSFYQAYGYLAWFQFPEKFHGHGNVHDLSLEHLLAHQQAPFVGVDWQ